jgi:enterochelin esterase-like enzyme
VVRETLAGPRADSTGVTFHVPDESNHLAAVMLHQEIIRPRRGPAFLPDPQAGSWSLRLARPAADRMEYRLEVEAKDARPQVICDPANPLRAPGPFGEKSVVEWPEYESPPWLGHTGRGGSSTRLTVPSRAMGARFTVVVWTSPAGSRSDPLPLLIAHDGPEYDAYSSLTRFLAWSVESGRLPPMRVALVPPVDRDQCYSASDAYAYALVNEILPRIAETAPVPPGNRIAGVGASLGALAMLHAHRRHPNVFGGLFLQSGSFFVPRLDAQESDFVRWKRITRFVDDLLGAGRAVRPIPLAMTCGKAEENLANNRLMTDALASQGYECTLHESRDAHNWISWRDTLDPHLTDVLARLWG